MLRKPSEYFNKKEEVISVNESVQDLVKKPEMNTFSDAFESFKNNLSKIEVLSEFSETLDNYRVNIERVNYLSEKVEDIQTEIKNLLKKEDLDRAMLSQLLVVEQNILEIQNKVKGINEKNLTEIRLDVSGLSETINDFIDIEVPRYKKLIVDSEIRIGNRYEQLEDNVNETLQGIGEFVDKKYDELTENLQVINEQSLSGIIEDFKILDNNVLKLKEQEIPRYKGFIVETERKVEHKLDEFNEKLDETFDDLNQKVEKTLEDFDDQIVEKIDTIKSSIKEIDEKFEELKEQEIPRYKGFIVETERKVEHKLDEFNEKLDETVNDVIEKINSVETISSSVEKEVAQKIEEVQNLQKRVNNELKNVEEKKEELGKKVIDLEVEIIRNESHIRTQNEYIENIQEEVRGVIYKLNIEELEEKNYELSKKIKYLEEVFKKFNSETLTEGLLNEPPEVKNKDTLTPLDKNFVTLDQLQEHYRLFINRIQQQLSTLGGGGETRLKYLDDIVGIATNASAYDNKYLKYNHSIGKFEFVAVSGAGGGESYWSQGVVGIVTTSNVGINTDNPTSALYVVGDAMIVGVVTATDFNSASDINLKDNISVIDNPLDKIVKLEGVNFNWKDTGKKSLGVIAQEVEKVLPELVSGKESKTVNYNGIIGLLIECVKEQQKEIDELKKLIDK